MNTPGFAAGGVHVYVDESTARDYLLMCAIIPTGNVADARAAMRRLLLPGQRSLHMKDERGRANLILSTIVGLGPHVVIYRVVRGTSAMEARRRCVQAISAQVCRLGADRMVLDSIDSVIDRDRSWIIAGARQAGHPSPPFSYHHQRRHEEPLLWIADAVGWAWARGRDHRAMIDQIVTVVDL